MVYITGDCHAEFWKFDPIIFPEQDSVKVSTGPAQRKKGAPKRPCKHLFFARPESIFNQI